MHSHTRRGLAVSFALHASAMGIVFAITNLTLNHQSTAPTTISLSSFSEPQREYAPQQVQKHDRAQKEIKNTPLPKEVVDKPIEESKKELKTVIPTYQPKSSHETSAPKASTQKQEVKVDESDEYARLNRAKIKEIVAKYQTYPIAARKSRCEGVCSVSFRLHPAGQIDETKIIKSSGYATLDRSSIKAIEEAASELPRPKQTVTLIIPVEYKL